MKSFEPSPRPSTGPVGSTSPMLGFIGAEQICLSLCLFVLVFVSLIVCVYTHFCSWPSQVFLPFWQFSAWSPLMWLSVYLLSQHNWFIYIYIARKWQQRITFTVRGQKVYISSYLFTHTLKKSVFLWCTCGTDSQMLWILSDMKWSQPQEMWQMPLGR